MSRNFSSDSGIIIFNIPGRNSSRISHRSSYKDSFNIRSKYSMYISSNLSDISYQLFHHGLFQKLIEGSLQTLICAFLQVFLQDIFRKFFQEYFQKVIRKFCYRFFWNFPIYSSPHSCIKGLSAPGKFIREFLKKFLLSVLQEFS